MKIRKCSICGREHGLLEFGLGWICQDCISFIKVNRIEDFE